MEYKKYPAQMLEVAGDLRRAPAKFENIVDIVVEEQPRKGRPRKIRIQVADSDLRSLKIDCDLA